MNPEDINFEEDTVELPKTKIMNELAKQTEEANVYGNAYGSVEVKDFDDLWDTSKMYHNKDIEAFEDLASTDKIPVAEINKALEEQKQAVSNVKCIYDVTINAWKIYCNLDGKEVSKIYCVDKEKINNLLDFETDITLVDALEEFDKDMKTNIKSDYLSDNLKPEVIYDLRGIITLQKEMLNNKQKNIIKKNAKIQKKKGAEVFYFSNTKSKKSLSRTLSENKKQNKNLSNTTKKAIVGTAIGASAALASLGVATELNNQADESVAINKEIGQRNSKPLDKELKLVDSNKKGVIIKLEPKKDEIEEVVQVEPEVKVGDLNENIVYSLPEESLVNNIKLGDNIYFNDTLLSYDCYNTSPRINTNDLNFDHYKLCYIAILRGGKVIDVLDSSKIDYLKDKTFKDLEKNYESKLDEDIEIAINVDGTYSDVSDIDGQFIRNQGWINIKYLTEENISIHPFEKGKTM